MSLPPLSTDASHAAFFPQHWFGCYQLPQRRVRRLSGAPVGLIPAIVMTGAGAFPGWVGEGAIIDGEKYEDEKFQENGCSPKHVSSHTYALMM